MRQIAYIGAVLILLLFMGYSNGSALTDAVYFVNQDMAIGLFALGCGISEIRRGRRAFFLSLSVFQFIRTAYSSVDYRGEYAINIYLALAMCICVITIFLIGFFYDRKIKRSGN